MSRDLSASPTSRARIVSHALAIDAELPIPLPGLGCQSLSSTSRTVLFELIVGGASLRVEIARKLGASKSSLTRSTRSLVNSGLIIEGATELRSALGRPSEMLVVAADAMNFAGVKLTGDRLYAVVTDLRGRVVESLDEPLDSVAPESVVSQLGRIVDGFRVRFPKLVAVGVTLAGSIVRSRTGGLLLEESEFLGWHDLLLADLLGERVGVPVAIENDLHALAATEHWFGAGAGAGLESMALITIGEGIGCGLVANGKLVNGASGLAGRINHHVITGSGPKCGLGHVGCASAYLTNSSIARAVGRDDPAPISYDLALERARAGDPVAVQAFDDAGFALGTLIGTVTDLFDPLRVVLSGDGIALWDIAPSAIAAGFLGTTGRAIDVVDIRVRPFDFGEWARSAAVVALRSILAT